MASILLTTSAMTITAGCVGVLGMYIIKNAEETPEMIQLQCAIGIEREECPSHQDALNALQHDLDALAAQRAAFEAELAALNKKLAGLYEIQKLAKGGITAFNNVAIPSSRFSMTIGTKYSNLIDNPHSKDVQWFCYISLDNGTLNEDRNLNIRSSLGNVSHDAKKLQAEGITQRMLDDAMALCKPTIAGAA